MLGRGNGIITDRLTCAAYWLLDFSSTQSETQICAPIVAKQTNENKIKQIQIKMGTTFV